MNEKETVGRLHFISLEVTDEMPTNGRTTSCHLAKCLLDAVFADVFEARMPCSGDCIRPMRLCNGDDPNLLAMPSPTGGFADPLPNLG
jgi:hypothetical protein